MVKVCVAAWIGLWAGWVGFGWMASIGSQTGFQPLAAAHSEA